MKKLAILLFAIMLTLFVFIACDNEESNDDKQKETVTITLNADEHCTVDGDNVLTVEKGEDAEFSVKFADGYELATLTYGDYKDGAITVKNCIKDRTITLKSQLIGGGIGMVKLDIYQNNNEYGNVTSSHTGYIEEDTEVTVTASPHSGKVFLCWTKNKALKNGGEQFSYSPSYTFEIENKTTLFANYLCEGEKAVIYHLCGGATSGASGSVDSGLDSYIELYASDKLCVNLVGDTGLFEKEGHTLLEYTYTSDYTGDAVNPGGLVKMNGTVLDVYAKWAKWSDDKNFVYTKSSAGATITSYNANEDFLVIPAKLDGFPVTKIASGAFNLKSFSTLIIPSSVKTVEANAFKNCKSFDTLYITDSFTSISDNAFSGCKKFSKLCLNAAILPMFCTSPESMAARLEVILTRDSSKNMILVVGGSNVLHGFKAQEMERLLNYEYQVLNCGSNASGAGILYMEAFGKFLRADDIIINAPEYASNQMGGTSFVWRTFRATEGCYNIYRYVDFSKYSGFFDAMSAFNSPEARNGKGGAGYGVKPTELTEKYCDYAKNTTNAGSFAPFAVGNASLSEASAEVINNLYSELSSNGIKYYFSFAPIYSAYGSPTEQNISDLKKNCEALLDCPIISIPTDYLFTGEYYYDSNYHLTTSAAILRTEKLYADLSAQLKKE